jgi:putative transposase
VAQWYYPLTVDSEKRTHGIMSSSLLPGGDFLCRGRGHVRNDLELVLNKVKQLDATDAIIHSDQGFQYTTKSYSNLLEELSFTGSHSRRGNCFDNACIESFFSHLKTEKLYLEKPKDMAHARQLIAEYIEYYNTQRFQKKLGDLSPVEYRAAIAA